MAAGGFAGGSGGTIYTVPLAGQKVTNYLKPAITKTLPANCIPTDKEFTIVGVNLNDKSIAKVLFETGVGKRSASIISANISAISTHYPAKLGHKGKVTLSLQSTAGAIITNKLSVAICYPVTDINSKITDREATRPLLPTAISSGNSATSSENAAPAAEEGSELQSTIVTRTDYLEDTGDLTGSQLPNPPSGIEQRESEDNQKSINYVTDEIILINSSMQEASRAAEQMSQYSARLLVRKKLSSLGLVLSVFRVPDQQSVLDIIQNIRQQSPNQWLDANHYYHPLENDRNSVFEGMVGVKNKKACDKVVRIGMLDAEINTKHPYFYKASIKQHNFLTRGSKKGDAQHATAIASIFLANTPEMRGLLRKSLLFNAIVIGKNRGNDKPFTTIESLISGLDWLLKNRVQVINLSLGGPYNQLLDLAIQRVTKKGIGVIAASGNGGSNATPVYPAAFEQVISVVAVDQNQQRAEDAQTGDYIDLAAPGVDVWVADVSAGGRFASGSSIATPWVTAALGAMGGGTTMKNKLFKRANDIGKKGKDPEYGWGLVKFPVACK